MKGLWESVEAGKILMLPSRLTKKPVRLSTPQEGKVSQGKDTGTQKAKIKESLS